jgi:RimJ/RimL family protein N-acetyltransferase/predicted ester cyclase
MSTPYLVTEFYERLWGSGDRSALSKVLHEGVRFRGSLGSELKGSDEFWNYLCEVKTALSEYRCDVVECVAEGDAAFARMRFSGLHVGRFRGFEPTGKAVEWSGAAHFTFRDGRISQVWVLGDLFGLDALLRQNQKAPNKQAPMPTTMVTLKPLSASDAPIDARIPAEFIALAEALPPWTSYIAYARDAHVVGTCAFKRPPGADRSVEIAYLTFPEFEGRGYGTAMARALVELAGASGQVTAVIARTLKEENASVRICRRLDFAFEGEVPDPEDGVVWQWKKPTSRNRRP